MSELDFSQFHPLDHRPASARCRSFPGGTRNHIKLWWQYKFEYTPRKVWHRWFLCRLGWHDIQGGEEINLLGRVTHIQRCCVWCWKGENQ